MDSSRVIYIYALVDPRSDEVRYIGKSTDPKARLWAHCSPRGCEETNHKANWIKQLRANGLRPQLLVLAESDEENWASLEQFLIRAYREQGHRLTNLTDGGWGTSGMIRPPPSEGQRERMRLAHLGYRHSDASRARISEALRGRPMSERTRVALQKSRLGRHHTPEARAKIGAANRGRTWTEAERATHAKRIKLTDADVVRMREEGATGELYTVLAERYGVSRSTVGLTLRGLMHRSAGGPVEGKRKTGPKPRHS